MSDPFLLGLVASIAQRAFDSGIALLIIVFSRFSSVTFEIFLVGLKLRLAGKRLITVWASDVRQVVEREHVLGQRDPVGKFCVLAVAALPTLSYVQVDEINMLSK